MSISGNSQSSTSLDIVSYRHKFLLYMYMYTTIKNTSSVKGQGSADLAVIAASWGPGT